MAVHSCVDHSFLRHSLCCGDGWCECEQSAAQYGMSCVTVAALLPEAMHYQRSLSEDCAAAKHTLFAQLISCVTELSVCCQANVE